MMANSTPVGSSVSMMLNFGAPPYKPSVPEYSPAGILISRFHNIPDATTVVVQLNPPRGFLQTSFLLPPPETGVLSLGTAGLADLDKLPIRYCQL